MLMFKTGGTAAGPFISIGSRVGGGKRLTGKRILIVEDDWFIAGYVSETLEAAGAAPVGPVATAGAALELLEREPAPDAATLDFTLLDGDSVPVARRLAAMEVPFLLLSATTGASLPDDLAARPRLAKPFGGFQVVDALADMIEA